MKSNKAKENLREILIKLEYSESTSELKIIVKECRDISPSDQNDIESSLYIKTYLIYDNKEKHEKQKSKLNETISYIMKNVLTTLNLSVALWRANKYKWKKSLGEVQIELDKHDFTSSEAIWYNLEQEKKRNPIISTLHKMGIRNLSIFKVFTKQSSSKSPNKDQSENVVIHSTGIPNISKSEARGKQSSTKSSNGDQSEALTKQSSSKSPNKDQSENVLIHSTGIPNISKSEARGKQSSSKSPNKDQSENEKNEIFELIGYPFGLPNPMNFCFLNSVIQIIRTCKDFIVEYLSKDISSKESSGQIFQNLLEAYKHKNGEQVNETIEQIQKKFKSSDIEGDDVHIFFLKFLSQIHQDSKDEYQENNEPDSFYERKRKINNSLVYKYFYGVMKYITYCKNCSTEKFSSYQLFKSFPIPVPSKETKQSLQEAINSSFESDTIDLDDEEECCQDPNILTKPEMIRAPEYMFLYLNRGTIDRNGKKINTELYVDNETIEIKISDETRISYKLIGVIDHWGDSSGGHYFCKCNFPQGNKSNWWLFSDNQCEQTENPVTKNTNAFMFKRRNQNLPVTAV